VIDGGGRIGDSLTFVCFVLVVFLILGETMGLLAVVVIIIIILVIFMGRHW
jgi:hypothetical protein